MQIKWGYTSINGDYVFAKTAKELSLWQKNNPGVSVCDLTVGDTVLPPPPAVCDALSRAAESCRQEGFCKYGDERGQYAFRARIAEEYKSLGERVQADEVFITNGAKPCLGELLSLARFERALIQTPTYPLYEELCNLEGVQTTFVREGELERALLSNSVRPDVIFICSPCNPSASVLTAKQIKALCDYANSSGATVIIDGAYACFLEGGAGLYRCSGCESIVEVRTYSKSLSFAGLRCGYTVIKKQSPLHRAYTRYLSLHSNGVNLIVQEAALKSYEAEAKEQIAKTVAYYRKNAEILSAPFKKWGYKCVGGYFAPYLLCSVGEGGARFGARLLDAVGVAVLPGEAFRAQKAVRLSCLCKREVATEAAKRLEAFFQSQKVEI